MFEGMERRLRLPVGTDKAEVAFHVGKPVVGLQVEKLVFVRAHDPPVEIHEWKMRAADQLFNLTDLFLGLGFHRIQRAVFGCELLDLTVIVRNPGCNIRLE